MPNINSDGLTDASRFNDSEKNARKYSDLDLFFEKKSNKDIKKITDILAVKRAVRNLIFTNVFDKPFHPEISSGVRDMLFENMTPLTAVLLTKKIEDVIANFEPRVRLTGISSVPNLDANAYEVTLQFFIVNTPTEPVELTVFLERLR